MNWIADLQIPVFLLYRSAEFDTVVSGTSLGNYGPSLAHI